MEQMFGNMEEFVKSIPDFQINCGGISCSKCPMTLVNTYSVDGERPEYSCARNIIKEIKNELEKRMSNRCSVCGQIIQK